MFLQQKLQDSEWLAQSHGRPPPYGTGPESHRSPHPARPVPHRSAPPWHCQNGGAQTVSGGVRVDYHSRVCRDETPQQGRRHLADCFRDDRQNERLDLDLQTDWVSSGHRSSWVSNFGCYDNECGKSRIGGMIEWWWWIWFLRVNQESLGSVNFWKFLLPQFITNCQPQSLGQ